MKLDTCEAAATGIRCQLARALDAVADASVATARRGSPAGGEAGEGRPLVGLGEGAGSFFGGVARSRATGIPTIGDTLACYGN